jgi:predicted O-methyltransferase YrrM
MNEAIYSRSHLAIKYLKYFFSSSNRNGHGIHSPFVFDFVVHVLQNKQEGYSPCSQIESLRRLLIGSLERIPNEDLGAGSSRFSSATKSISSIAKSALKPPKYARLLYRIVSYYKPNSILELGTSFGLTTQYLALANTNARVITIEGSPAIANIAQQGFKKNDCKNIELIVGDFSTELEKAIQRMKGIKLFYIDGNHRYESTIKYFNEIVFVSGEDDILIFDDIHWSKGMGKAWQEIKKDGRVRCTIDLFFIGLVFLKKSFVEKQDFVIQF